MAKAELVLVGTDDGVVLLSNPGGIGRWLKAAHMLHGQQITATWAHPLDPTQMLCSSADQRWRSQDGGQSWHPIEIPAFVQLIAVRTTPDRIWGHTGEVLYVSNDAGITWSVVAAADHVASGGERTWYRHGHQSLLSADGGLTWQHVDDWHHSVISHDGQHLWYMHHAQLCYEATPIQTTPPTAFRPLIACAGTAGVVGLSQTGVWRFVDEWQSIETLAHATITTMTTTIYHPDRAWAGDAAGNVWYSSDRCVSWQIVRAGFGPIRSLSSARLL